MPEKKAVAIGMSEGRHKVPVVLAKGEGDFAEEILRVARENGVPVQESAGLADLLMALDAEQDIPIELYAALAEILACIQACDRSLKPDETPPSAPATPVP